LLSDRVKLIQLNTTATALHKDNRQLTPDDEVLLYGGVEYDVTPAEMRETAMHSGRNSGESAPLPEEILRGSGPGGFGYLSGSRKEIDAIAAIAARKKFETRIFYGRAATEEEIKSLSGPGSPAILHIATHGFFFPDPSHGKGGKAGKEVAAFRSSTDPLFRSGLALSGANNAWAGKPVAGIQDGILTAFEVSSMYLPHTKLAVLSACETGLGEVNGSEGVYGLQRAFRMAGVEHLVMSLWKVPDLETAEFMQLFYRNLFSRQSITEAFHDAQSRMRDKYRNQPYKWAAWILTR
jgi:CHAT domain-containing protein